MEHLSWGLQMTVLGMGLVFAMLVLLWGLLTLVLKMEKEDAPQVASPPQTSDSAPAEAPIDQSAQEESPDEKMVNGMPGDLVAAIMIAVMKHRSSLRRQAAPITRTTWPGSQLYASRWVAVGRSRQNNSWQPKGR